MGSHRADTRASRDRNAVTQPTSHYPVSQPGKRAARKNGQTAPAASHATGPSRVVRPPVETTTQRRPVVEAPRRSAVGRRSAPRKSLIRGLPSAPILLGIAALAVSAGGALTAGDPQLVGAADKTPPAKIMQASALSGTGGVATTVQPGSRGPVVSRDSRRDAQPTPPTRTSSRCRSAGQAAQSREGRASPPRPSSGPPRSS